MTNENMEKNVTAETETAAVKEEEVKAAPETTETKAAENTISLQKETETEGIDMINTEKVYRSYDDPNDRKITVDEMIEKIIKRTGVTKEQACEALEKNKNDLLDAMIYIERTYGPSAKAKEAQQEAAQAATAAQAAQTAQAAAQTTAQQTTQQAQTQTQQAQAGQQTYSYAPPILNEKKPTGADVKNVIRKFIDILVNNNLVIYKDGQEVIALPILIVLVASLVSISSILVIGIVAMFFGVTYRIKGPDVSEHKPNVVLDTLSGMAKNIKNAFTTPNKY